MYRAARRLLTLLLGTALVAAPLALVAAPAQAAEARAVVGWGDNYAGAAAAPASLLGRNVTAVAAGGNFSLALTDDGSLTAWGYDGQGQTDVPDSLTGERVTAIAAGAYHALAVTDDGAVTAWGDSGRARASVPASLAGKRVAAVSAGLDHSLALTEDGVVTAWGNNSFGQTNVPDSLTSKRVTAISAGSNLSLALTDDGVVTAWGLDPSLPTSLNGKRVTAIDAGNASSFALTDEGAIITWGSGPDGPMTVPGSLTSRRVAAIDAGYSHALALVAAPTVATGLDGDRTSMEAGASVTFTPVVSHATPQAPSTWTVTGAEVESAVDPATGEVTLSSTRAGTRTATLSIPTDLGTVTRTVTVLVTPAGATALALEVSGANATSGDMVSVGATGTDRFGNPTGDESKHVTLSSSDRTDAVSGTTVRLGSAGPRTLTATHRNGTIATVRVDVAAAPTTTVPSRPAPPTPVATLPAARLGIAVTGKPVVRGTRTTVSVARLAPRERYTVRIAGRTVARGVADARGRGRRAVVVPRTRPAAGQLVVVTGSQKNRVGRGSLAVVTGRLTATAKKSQARASTKQRITVRGLVPGQKVRVTYRGKTVSAAKARASKNGTYTVRFDVGQRWGTKNVTVRSGDRTTRTSFAVTPRHG